MAENGAPATKALIDGVKLLEKAFKIAFVLIILGNAYPDLKIIQMIVTVGSMVVLAISYVAFSKLEEYSKRYAVGRRGTRDAMVGLILLLASPLLTPFPLLSALLLGLSLAYITFGTIMYLIALWRLGEERGGERIRSGVFLEVLWTFTTMVILTITYLYAPSYFDSVLNALLPTTFLAQAISLILIILGLRGIVRENSSRKEVSTVEVRT